nr:tRNA threonylcarbamoyladenosine dehydratase [Butyrivibrio hungatei]
MIRLTQYENEDKLFSVKTRSLKGEIMSEQFSRTALLIGQDKVEELHKKRVAVFGIGGVGGYVCEVLVRSGIGAFDLIDNDTVCLSNLNRQIIATRKTIGRYKTEVMKERMLDINPDVDVTIHNCFFLPENADEFDFSQYDYVVDAVDTVTAKIELIMRAQKENVPVISAMGAGNKLDASRFKVADIYDTSICPLARVMRRELKKRNVKHLKVVYSDEEPITPMTDPSNSSETDTKPVGKRTTPGSTAFVPAVAGLLIAGEIVKDLSGI